jgi:hypothetical protein
MSNSDYLVLRICTAYEQGVGHAQRADLDNPYVPCTPEAEAWWLGREQGLKALIEIEEVSP